MSWVSRYFAVCASIKNAWCGAAPRRRQRPGRLVLRLEALEDRTVPAPLLSLVSPADPVLPPSDSAGGVTGAQVSANGRFTVYSSTASNVILGQVNTAVVSNVFLHDQQTGTTTLVSHTPGSTTTGANGNSDTMRISGDGRFVAYRSTAANLVAGQSGPANQLNVFLYDRVSGNNALISHRFDSATTSANDDSDTFYTTGFGFSNNTGRFLLFSSSATDLIASQGGPTTQNLFLYDTVTGSTTLVSHDAFSALTGGDDAATYADLTPDGNSIVYHSFATDVVAGQGGIESNIFLYDRATNSSRLVSAAASGVTNEAAGFSFDPLISADGRTISYLSDAPNLVIGQTTSGNQGTRNVFTYDTVLNTTSLVSGANGSSTVTANDHAGMAALSSDGSTIAFTSAATNLTAGQGGNTWNVFLYDTATTALTLVSHVHNAPAIATGGTNTTPSNTFNDLSLSSDGRFVAYQSTAADLIAGFSGLSATANVFVYDSLSGDNTLVSRVNGAPTEAGNQNTFFSRLSVDGSTVILPSFATNLTPGLKIVDGGENLYRFNRATDTGPTLVSRVAFQATATSQIYGTNFDGRFVVFTSNSPSVVPNQIDTNFDQDVFLLDRQTGATTLVSHIPGAPQTTANKGSPTAAGVVNILGAPVISNDGNFVAFVSQATNLVAGQSGPASRDQVYLFNRLTGEVTLVSRQLASPTSGGNAFSNGPVISADGRYVAYQSHASDLIDGLIQPGPGTLVANVYLYDTVAGTTTLVSHTAGDPKSSGDFPSISPAISDDGRFVAYQSQDPNQVAGGGVAPTNNIFLFDRLTGSSTLVSHIASSAATSPTVSSTSPVLSADGKFVAFVSFATDLVPGQSGDSGGSNVFLYNRQTGVITLVSGANGSASVTANAYSDSPVINEDGTFVAFRSFAANLVAGQTGPAGSNIFLFSQQGGSPTVTLVSHANGSPTTTAAGQSTVPAINGDGTLVAYLSTAPNLVPGQSGGGVNNVFGWARTLDTNFLVSGVDDSPTVISPIPTFLPIISRDPVILFSASGSLLEGGPSATNGYANPLIDVAFTPAALLDGSPAGTVAGTLSTTSVLVGQVLLPTFSLPAGAAADNHRFAAGATAADGTAPLAATAGIDIAVQSSFSILVRADTGLGVVQKLFVLTAAAPSPVPSNLVDIAKQLTHSTEYFRYTLTQAYLSFVNRAPDESYLQAIIPLMQSGVVSGEYIEALFIGAPEYIAKKGGTDELWIRSMYTDLLFRTPRADELTYWNTRLQQIRQQHAAEPGFNVNVQAALEFDTSDEREGYRVQANYTAYLGRLGNTEEVTYWVIQFKQFGQTSEDLAAGFVASFEYFNRPSKGQGDRSAWVQASYLDVLHRPAGGAEVDYWVGLML